MAFPRSFKNETWFMRLPSGEIEVATATDLEGAFRCGLADARTPVRSVSSPVWRTLAEVANIETCDSRSLGSLLPVTVEEPAADLVSGASWRVRPDDRLHAFRSGAGRILRGGLALVGFLALTAFGGTELAQHAFAGTNAPGHREARVAASSREGFQLTKVELHPHAKLTPAEEHAKRTLARRLREADAIRRMEAIASPRRTKLRQEQRSTTPVSRPVGSSKSGPFTNGGDRFDPLNGSL
jgi:hypothetical protein